MEKLTYLMWEQEIRKQDLLGAWMFYPKGLAFYEGFPKAVVYQQEDSRTLPRLVKKTLAFKKAIRLL